MTHKATRIDNELMDEMRKLIPIESNSKLIHAIIKEIVRLQNTLYVKELLLELLSDISNEKISKLRDSGKLTNDEYYKMIGDAYNDNIDKLNKVDNKQ